jgi:hypothetical protein
VAVVAAAAEHTIVPPITSIPLVARKARVYRAPLAWPCRQPVPPKKERRAPEDWAAR